MTGGRDTVRRLPGSSVRSVALVAVALSLVSTLLSAAPALSPDVETELVGAGAAPRGEASGTWLQEPGRLTLSVPDSSGVSVWLAEQGDLADGFVRWRVSDWRVSGAKLLLRARVDASRTYGLSGYVLVVSNDSLELWRTDEGVTRPTGFVTKAKGLGKVATLEVAVWMIGPHGSAQVFDGTTLPVTPLASLAWTDTRYTAGRVGVLVDRRDGKCPVTTGLSLRASGQPVTPAPALDTRVPGPWRFLFLDEGAWPSALPELRASVHVLEGADPSGRLLVRADEAAAERLRRAGLVRGRLEADTPLRLIDDTVRAGRAAFDAGSNGYDRGGGVWHDADMLHAALDQAASSGSHVSVHELGRTHEGRPILAVHLAARTVGAPSVLLLGGVHGCELIGPEIVLDAVRALARPGVDADLAAWRDRVDVWAIPDANPDGRTATFDTSIFTGRKNGRGVDLNRNFPFAWGALGEEASKSEPGHDWYRGPFAASEPEVQAILRLAERETFVAALSFHSKGTMLLYPYQAKVASLPKGDEAEAIARELGEALPVQLNGRRVRVLREMYPVVGVAEDTLRHAHGTLALLLEAAEENPEEPAKRRRLVEDARPAWRGLLQRVVEGPRLSLKVVDGAKRPLCAAVEIVGEARAEGEVWATRCRDGRYDRLLDEARPVRVRVRAGGMVKEQTIVVAKGAARPVTVSLKIPADEPTARLAPTAAGELSVDGRCAREAGRCEPDLAPAACWIDGACVLAGAVGRENAVCAPARDAFGWTVPSSTAAASSDAVGLR